MKKLLVAILLCFSLVGRAEIFKLPTLDTSMTDPVFQTLASGFLFHSIEPASDLGTVWGVYLGVTGTATDSSKVASIFTNMSTQYFPTADLQIGVGLPKGITLQFATIPKVTYSDTMLKKYAAEIKWTMTRVFLKHFPLEAALSVNYSNSSLSYAQALNGGNVRVDYDGAVWGAMLTLGKQLGSIVSIDPFAGVGFASSNSSLSGTGTASLYGGDYPAGTTSANATHSSLWLRAGLLLKLGVLGIAGEYDYVFGIGSYNGKVTFRF